LFYFTFISVLLQLCGALKRWEIVRFYLRLRAHLSVIWNTSKRLNVLPYFFTPLFTAVVVVFSHIMTPFQLLSRSVASAFQRYMGNINYKV